MREAPRRSHTDRGCPREKSEPAAQRRVASTRPSRRPLARAVLLRGASPPAATSRARALAQAVLCGLALCILTMLVEVTLFIIGASRVDAKSHRRSQAAAKGLSSDLARLQETYGRSRLAAAAPPER